MRHQIAQNEIESKLNRIEITVHEMFGRYLTGIIRVDGEYYRDYATTELDINKVIRELKEQIAAEISVPRQYQVQKDKLGWFVEVSEEG